MFSFANWIGGNRPLERILPEEDIYRGLKEWTALPSVPSAKKKKSSESFKHVSDLLRSLEARHPERKGWSSRPRTYTILFNIGLETSMHHFIEEGRNDLSLPYTWDTFPHDFEPPQARQNFLRLQSYVLTDAKDLEINNTSHVHFGGDADIHFYRFNRLGTGRSGFVF